MYLHGLFTTFSEDVQQSIINKIKGLEKAIITRPGYGVEYDYLLPFQIKTSMESKINKNIFFAGQINGTTGYEEAAAQGLIAGLNASLSICGREKIIINREDGYIGVLLDDIVTKGVHEPYRMLTSRNEFRLSNRHDNADIRMASFLKKINNIKKAEKIEKKYKKVEIALQNFKKSSLYSDVEFMENLRQDRLEDNGLSNIAKVLKINDSELEKVIINLKYEFYLDREAERIKELRTHDAMIIPEDIAYSKVKNLSNEALRNLTIHKPETVEQASRLEGVRPLDTLSLISYLKTVSRET
jgi:tRNA uridine 5-carboxymethylaminomethyl modification enzyme